MDWVTITCFAVFFIITALPYIANEENHADSILGWVWEGICCIFIASLGGFVLGTLLSGFLYSVSRGTLQREERVSFMSLI